MALIELYFVTIDCVVPEDIHTQPSLKEVCGSQCEIFLRILSGYSLMSFLKTTTVTNELIKLFGATPRFLSDGCVLVINVF